MYSRERNEKQKAAATLATSITFAILHRYCYTHRHATVAETLQQYNICGRTATIWRLYIPPPPGPSA